MSISEDVKGKDWESAKNRSQVILGFFSGCSDLQKKHKRISEYGHKAQQLRDELKRTLALPLFGGRKAYPDTAKKLKSEEAKRVLPDSERLLGIKSLQKRIRNLLACYVALGVLSGVLVAIIVVAALYGN